MATIVANKTADANPCAGSLELLVELGLTDPERWYLCADPTEDDGQTHAWVDRQGLAVAMECVDCSTQSEQLKENARFATTSVMQRLAEELTDAAEHWERKEERARIKAAGLEPT